MSTIHVAGGVGVAPTEMSAYDAALADANLHNYNLIAVSSVIPAEATLEVVDAAPDLGPAGNRLTVVQGKTVAGPDSSAAEITTGIGWATGPGPGLFYEASGTDPEAVEAEIRRGLDAGCELREWTITDRDVLVSTAEPAADSYTAAVVLAAYGESEPIL
jgi:arginine decarboxylase